MGHERSNDDPQIHLLYNDLLLTKQRLKGRMREIGSSVFYLSYGLIELKEAV